MTRHLVIPRQVLAVLLGLGLTLALGGLAAVSAEPGAALVPSAAHNRATALVNRLIERQHYLDVAVDDALSARVYDRYLESLDPQRSYFLAADVASFARYRTRMDDALRNARLEPVFKLFSVYRARLAERGRHALRVLDGPLTFMEPEEYPVDRSTAPWAKDRKELDDLWRRRVKHDLLNLLLAGREEPAARATLRRRYEALLRRGEQLNADDAYQVFMNAYTGSVEPHTAYLSPRSSENFQIQLSLSLEGIGAALQSEDEYTVVQRIIPGGPASLNGELQPQDRITAVGQGGNGPLVDVVGWRLDDVVELIRGPKGTTVRLEVVPKGAPEGGPRRVVSLVRDRVRLEEQAAKSSILEIFGAFGAPRRVGVIDIPTFYLDTAARARGDPDYRSTTRDVARLLAELQQERVDGVLVDLRGDGGGALTEAIELTGLFIPTGPVVQVRDSTGKVQVLEDADPTVVYRGPLAVLVDRQSASASEIFAAAIQDYGRGIVVGEPTFGKGTVQSLFELARFARGGSGDLGQLKVTVAQFFRVNGSSTQHRGVQPDLVFPSVFDPTEEGERALPNAMPWAEVDGLKFRAAGDLSPFLREVRARHLARVASDPGFRWLLEEAAVEKAAQNRPTVSLRESRRRAERDAEEEARSVREASLRRSSKGVRGRPTASRVEPQLASSGEEPREDIWLAEAAQVLGDLVDVGQSLPQVQAARGEGEPGLCLPLDCPRPFR